MSTADIDGLIQALEAAGIDVDTSESTRRTAAGDASQLHSPPVVVVRPTLAEQVSTTVTLCRRHGAPVTVAGGYTGLSGGALGYGAVRIEMRGMDTFRIDGGTVHAQAGASVPEVIRQCRSRGLSFPFQPASACRSRDVYDYLGHTVGPVTVGGSLGANASGLVGCKLGAALDWVRHLKVVHPDGSLVDVRDGFDRYVGTEGRYGIVVEATIALAPLPHDISTVLVRGRGIDSFTAAAVAIGRSNVLPLLAECMVATERPPDFDACIRRTLEDPEAFIERFGVLLGPGGWLILLQGSPEEVDACLEALSVHGPAADVCPLEPEEFEQIKAIRSAASDDIGIGVENPNPGHDRSEPVQRAARFLAEAIAEFGRRGMHPKAEHNLGMLRTFLEGDASRQAYRADIDAGRAFDDGSLALHNQCNGDIETLFGQLLSPTVTDDMRRRREAVNFPGNEDILVRAESFPETIALLDTLMHKYGACPVPLYYCHINFRKQPGWILLHNRLLIDVMEFPTR